MLSHKSLIMLLFARHVLEIINKKEKKKRYHFSLIEINNLLSDCSAIFYVRSSGENKKSYLNGYFFSFVGRQSKSTDIIYNLINIVTGKLRVGLRFSKCSNKKVLLSSCYFVSELFNYLHMVMLRNHLF